MAVRFQAEHGGLTLHDIEAAFSISDRPAERRRDAVDAPLDGRAVLGERTAMPRNLATKLQATLCAESQGRVESKLEMLVQAEGLTMRPGPSERLDQGLLALLREAITTCRHRRDVLPSVHVGESVAVEKPAGVWPQCVRRSPRIIRRCPNRDWGNQCMRSD